KAGSGERKLLHSRPAAGRGQPLRQLLLLLLLRFLLRPRQQDHAEIGFAGPALLVDDDLLRDRRERGEFRAHYVASLAADCDFETAIEIRGGDVLPSR